MVDRICKNCLKPLEDSFGIKGKCPFCGGAEIIMKWEGEIYSRAYGPTAQLIPLSEAESTRWLEVMDNLNKESDEPLPKSFPPDSEVIQALKELESPDPVHAPSHYITDIPHRDGPPLECIEIIEALGISEYFCQANIIKYVFRYRNKNGLQDLEKASWYLNLLKSTVTEKLLQTSTLEPIQDTKAESTPEEQKTSS